MPARSGDFKRAFDGVLSHHMGKVQLTVVFFLHRRRGTGRERCAPHQMCGQFLQAGDRQHSYAGGIGCLGSVLHRDIHGVKSGVPARQAP